MEPRSTPLRVAVRARPLLRRDGPAADLSIDHREFDRVFGADSSQAAVTQHCAAPLVDCLFKGMHGCLFAFGQTGAGKTFSMLGAEGGRRRACQDGVLPLATGDIFRRVAQLEAEAAQAGSSSQYQLRASFVEVYRERVYDLLSPSEDARRQLRLREQADGSVCAEGATELPIRSIKEVLACVARGSAARATEATGVHEHSSRSHAVLTLTLEHRWRTDRDDGMINKQHAKLTLVDLAGSEDMTRSHGGTGNRDGIATNLGLHALTRVLAALASDAEHIPYRDATLTRLLQPALGGDCVTQMLACVSPAEQDAAETAATLRWAATARGLRSQARVHISEEVDTDPMRGDREDPSPLQRRALWLGPLPGCSSFTDEPVFARVAGDPADPLVLYVHGSGPRNSSMFWNNMVEAVDALHPNLYHVAICCPGYGRSPGDRQIIRSYPGALIEGVIRACGKRSAAALVGSSQGACAVMNALLERPALAESVAVCHPVGHAVERYRAIKVPALLIFDTEDAGHPVEVGRRMREALPNPTYFEFTHSKDGAWEEQNMAPEMVKILRGCASVQGRKRRRKKALPELSTLAGGMRAWTERYGDEHGWTWDVKEEVAEPPRVAAVAAAGPAPVQAEELFSESEDEEEAAAAAAAAAAEQAAAELAETTCALCNRGLGSEPVRLQRCRHALCADCCTWSLQHFSECPVCEVPVARAKAAKKAKKTKGKARGLGPVVSDAASIATLPPRASKAAVPPARVVALGYGNTTSKGKGKVNYSTFVKVCEGDRGAIQSVSFNINPGYDKPTAVLKAPNGSGGVWSFEYAMARPYPCEMTVHFQPQMGLPPLTIEYYVQQERKFMRRVAIELPAAAAKPRRAVGKGKGRGIVLEEEHCTSSGWFLADGGSWRWRGAGERAR